MSVGLCSLVCSSCALYGQAAILLAEPDLECLTSCKTGSEIEGKELRLAACNRRRDEDVRVSEVDAVGLTETLRGFEVATEIH